MRKFENILNDYHATKQKIQDRIKVTDFEIKDIGEGLMCRFQPLILN